MCPDNPDKPSAQIFKQLAHTLDSEDYTPDTPLLTSLIHSLPLNVYAKDTEGRFIFANRQYCGSVNLEHSEIIGKNDFEIHPGEMAEKYRQDDRKIMESRQPVTIEEAWQSIGGKRGYVQVVKAPLFDAEEQDKVIGTVGIFWDITDRKQAEIDLAEERNLLRTLIDNLPDAIYVKDKSGRFLVANSRVAKIMGANHHRDLIGKTDFDYYHREYAKKYHNDEQQILKNNKPLYDLEETVRIGDGTLRWFLTSKIPLNNINGEVIGIIGVGHDISQRREEENQRQRLEAQLQHAQRIETVGTLVAGIAHDFNNHLSVINGYAELLTLLPNTESSQREEFAKKILQAGKSAAVLTNQLMAFSKKQVIQPRIVDFNSLLSDIVNLLRPILGEHIDVELDLDPDIHHVEIDPTQVEQVVMNMAVNSRDAMPQGGTFRLATENIRLEEQATNNQTPFNLPAGDYIRLTVYDSGTGIQKEIRDRVFEPFFSTKEKNKGTGLGLSTVLGIIQQNGGTIELRADETPGTTFEIYLPGKMNVTDDILTESKTTDVDGGNETIFIAEDEQNVRALTQTILLAKGYKVFCGADGEDALRIISQNNLSVDLLLTDIIMPNINGKELAEKLLKQHPKMKVLFMSGYSDDTLSRYDISQKGTDFIRKPFKTDILTRKVRDLLDDG
ncbi:PAS domain-containing sensor histidine kinase [Desulfopila sp. IMCC35008]|uniref:hybrid sensor histidine kinase/response regulator n=1 Tax=Desulfopila sp. IMCC35008 TaxID=2653858 RepID=UPI0013D6184F|nr:PAS domain-containing sensor histidine kinase [Desulfopila sp. IMCC35008]